MEGPGDILKMCQNPYGAPGLCPGPLRELKRPSRPPVAVGGQIRKHFLKLLSRSLWELPINSHFLPLSCCEVALASPPQSAALRVGLQLSPENV